MNNYKEIVVATVIAIINDIEDQEEEEKNLEFEMQMQILHEKRRKRVCIKGYVEDIVPVMDDFRAHFRLKRSTFEHLMKLIAPRIKININSVGRPSGSIEKMMLVSLWMAANNCVYRDLCDRFDVAMSTAWEYFRCICNVLVNMSSTFIQWPKGRKANTIINEFKAKKNFINVLGAIDGTHIEICKPWENPESFFNRKKRYSIQAQVICDHTKLFIDVFTGYPGSVHDARVFKVSDIKKKIDRGDLLFPNDSHLLGDSAYENSKYLLTPYRDDGFLNDIKKKYNYIHSSTRVVIEQAIGLWKGRFRILRYLNVYNTEDIANIILALAVLHNICLGLGDDDVECYISDEFNEDRNVSENSSTSGALKRDQIAVHLFNN